MLESETCLGGGVIPKTCRGKIPSGRRLVVNAIRGYPTATAEKTTASRYHENYKDYTETVT
jgi:hypothetical protein